jgi:CMP-N-acetylneuraminic acid synthetase
MKKIKLFVIIKESSERVPSKNFKVLGDKPLWKHLLYELFPYDVFVDTDSMEVLEQCSTDTNLSHVTAYPRKQEHIDMEESKDETLSPVLHLIDNFLDQYANDDDIIVTTHVTSPFLTTRTIIDAVKKLDEGYDSVLSVTKHSDHSWLEDIKKYKPINFNPKVVEKTQSLKKIVMMNGAFFIFTKKMFYDLNKNRIGNNPYHYELPSPEHIEIDTYDDFNLANLVYKGLKK